MTQRTMVSTQQTSATRWEKTIDMEKTHPEPRTFQTLLLKKYRLEQLEENKEDGAGRSDQANAADIQILRKEIKMLEGQLKQEAELVSSDEDNEE